MLDHLIPEILKAHCESAGLELVNFCDVGLPCFLVEAVGLFREESDLGTIKEFVLRGHGMDASSTQSIANLLGLPLRLVRSVGADLVSEGFLATERGGALKPTVAGRKYLDGARALENREENLAFFYDGFTRQVIDLPDPRDLNTKSDAERIGLRVLRPIPARAPETAEVSLQQLKATASMRKTQVGSTLLSLVRRKRALQRYYDAVMALVRDPVPGTLQAAFFIDGVHSEQHTLSFLESRGLEKLRLADEVGSSESNDEQKAVLALTKDLNKRRVRPKRPKVLRRSGGRRVLSLKKSVGGESRVTGDEETVSQSEISAPFPISDRVVRVHEHAQILEWTLENARDRIVILSPWVTPRVVDRRFLENLDGALARGVNVSIGWGIGGEGEQNRAHEELQSRHDRRLGLTFGYLGDTHAKVLIADSSFMVITSFNWLSFRGDPKRKFREEYGQMNCDRVQIGEFADELRGRIEAL